MKPYRLMSMGTALLALGLGLASVVPSSASARDEYGTKSERGLSRIAQEDRDNDRDSNSGYLGVQVQRLGAALRRAKGIPESTEGTLVSNVEDGSPADEAGIKRGDVILRVNREETPNPGDLVRTVRGLTPGRRIPVQVWRDGVSRTFTLTVGSRPEGSDMPPMPPRWRDRGDTPRDDEPKIVLRGNQDDLERQVKELQAELQSLRSEVEQLRSDVNRQHNDRRSRDHDEDNDRNNDRDQNDEGD